MIPTPLEVLIGIVPTNPFAALAEGKVLQIIFFSALVGMALVVERQLLVVHFAGPGGLKLL